MSESEVWQAIEKLEERLGAFIAGVELPRPASATAALYNTNIAQSFGSGLAQAIVNYGTAIYDQTGGLVTNPTTAWRYTAASSGLYIVAASVLFASTTGWTMGEAGSLNVFKNNANYASLDRFGSIDSTTVAQFLRLRGVKIVPMVATDFIDIRLSQNTGAALALHTDATFNYVDIVRLP